jgi:hypothetical protein
MMGNALVGTWRLVSFDVRDDEDVVTYPFGREVEGFITYTSDGRMAVQFGAAHRARLADPDWVGGADADIAAAARAYFAYCGTYEIHGDTVVHRIESSLLPNWIGGEQMRHVTLNGDTVTLSTPPTLIDGRERMATLVWRRV